MNSVLGKAAGLAYRVAHGKEAASGAAHFYDLLDRDGRGEEVAMRSYEGQVLLVANVASK